MDEKKKPRFPLALPADLDKAVREYAKGTDRRAPVGINALLVFLIRKGLEAARKEDSAGNRTPTHHATA